jgi:hypothetical protein
VAIAQAPQLTGTQIFWILVLIVACGAALYFGGKND